MLLPPTRQITRELKPHVAQLKEVLKRRERAIRRARAVKTLALSRKAHVGAFLENVKLKAPGYLEATDALRRYLCGNLSLADFLLLVNTELEKLPTHWKITATTSPRLRFTIDKDAAGTLTAWKDLVFLIEHGATFDRFKVCPLLDERGKACGKLFWDSSLTNRVRYCTKKHKDAAHARTYRRK